MFDKPAPKNPSETPRPPSSPKQETDESEEPKGTLEFTRGTRLEAGSPSNTFRLRKHALRFFISRYQGTNHSSFECKEPGDESESWGIERPESDRQWDVPSRCAAMQDGYVYVFRGPKNGKLNKGVIYAAYEVKGGLYIPLEVTQDKVDYDKPQKNKKAETFAVLEKISAGVHIPPSGSLRIVESKIQLSQKRIFGPGGLKDDPVKRGIPYSYELEGTCDLPPAGQDPTKEEIEDYFGWSSVDALVRTEGAWDKPWQRQRRHHRRGQLDIVEFFSVDPFAEARRRNANFSNKVKAEIEYLEGPKRSNLVFLAEICRKKMYDGSGSAKHIENNKIDAWLEEDKKQSKKFRQAVDEAGQHCVDWLNTPLFREWLKDFTHSTSESTQALAIDAYLDAIADLNVSVPGNRYFANQYEDKLSFFNRGVGFCAKAKPSEGTAASNFAFIRGSLTSIVKIVELHAKKVVQQREKRITELTSSLPGRVSDAHNNVVTSGTESSNPKIDIVERAKKGGKYAENIGDAADAIGTEVSSKLPLTSLDINQKILSDALGLPAELAARETALSRNIRLGHKGAREFADFFERLTGSSIEAIQFRAHLEHLKNSGQIEADRIKDFLNSPLAKSLNINDLSKQARTASETAKEAAKQLAEEEAVARSVASDLRRKGPSSPGEIKNLTEAARNRQKLYTDLEAGTSKVVNRLGAVLDTINLFFAAKDFLETGSSGKQFTTEQGLNYLSALSSAVSTGLGFAANSRHATSVASAMGFQASKKTIDQALKGASKASAERLTEIAVRETTDKAIASASAKALSRVSGLFGVVGSCVDLFSGWSNMNKEIDQGDYDAALSWGAVAAGGAAGIAAGTIALIGAWPIAAATLTVAAVALPVIGTFSLLYTDDDDFAIWLQRSYFGTNPDRSRSLSSQIDEYYRITCKPTLERVIFKNDSVSLVVKPGVLAKNMELVVHLIDTAPSIFVRPGDTFRPGSNVPKLVGRRTYQPHELSPSKNGGYQPETVYYPTPFPVSRVKGVLSVTSGNDPSFRVETQFNERT